MQTYHKKGSWNAICDVCGFEFKSHELKQRWDGMRVCKEDWEARHPSDFQRSKAPKAPIPWASPDDTEGRITSSSSTNPSISASLEDLIYEYTGTGGLQQIDFPAANDAAFKNVSVVYSIYISGDEEYTILNRTILKNTANVPQANTIAAGAIGRFKNDPINNLWYRES